MVEKTVIVNNPLGIHARPAALLVQMASKFQAKIFLSKADIRGVNGKSIMSVMMLAAENGAEVTVNAEDTALRSNRLNLLSEIRDSLDRIADFSKIEG